MDFVKKHAKVISNVLVAVAVVIAIYIKWSEGGTEEFFTEYDLYIFAGIAVGFLVISAFNKRR